MTHIAILFRILASQNAGEQRTSFLSAERLERDLIYKFSVEWVLRHTDMMSLPGWTGGADKDYRPKGNPSAGEARAKMPNDPPFDEAR